MHRNRRLVLMDRAIPFLAGLVGLIALAGAVVVQLVGDARDARLAEDVAALRAEVAGLAAGAVAPTPEPVPEVAVDDGLADAVQALQEQVQRLEADLAERPSGSATPTTAGATLDPSLPVDDCIPVGTRFMASIGEQVAICQTTVVVRVNAITDDNIMAEDIGLIAETAFRPVPGTNCSLAVLEADGLGFAEMRVSCL